MSQIYPRRNEPLDQPSHVSFLNCEDNFLDTPPHAINMIGPLPIKKTINLQNRTEQCLV